MWQCKNCGAENNDANTRCGMCRTPRETFEVRTEIPTYKEPVTRHTEPSVTRFCKYCGKPLYTESGGPSPAFCPRCGKPLGGTVNIPRKPASMPYSRKLLLGAAAAILVVLCVILLAVGTGEPTKRQVREDIRNYYLDTALNPLSDRYTDYNVKIDRSFTEDRSYAVYCTVVNSNKHISCQAAVKLEYTKYDRGWMVDDCNSDDTVCTPLTGVSQDDLFDADELSSMMISSATADITAHTWKPGQSKDEITAKVNVVGEIMNTSYQFDATFDFDERKGVWEPSDVELNSFSIDFSPANGTWRGMIDGDTITIKISNAGSWTSETTVVDDLYNMSIPVTIAYSGKFNGSIDGVLDSSGSVILFQDTSGAEDNIFWGISFMGSSEDSVTDGMYFVRYHYNSYSYYIPYLVDEEYALSRVK